MAAPASSPPEVGGVMVRADIRSRAAAIPTWVFLGGLFALSFLYRFQYAIRDPAPWIFQDELAYAELAKSFGSTGEFAIRAVEGTGGFAVLYPILIAAPYALFDSIPDAYNAIRVINCLLMSSTVVPVYFIARRLSPRYLALLAAALSVGLAPITYTGNVMTENAFYPLVALWMLAVFRALERPTLLRQLLVFGIFGLAFLTRVQGVVLLPALVLTVLLVVLLDALADREGLFLKRLAANALRFWPTWAVLGLGSVAVVVRQAARGASLDQILGAYGGVSSFTYDPAEIAHWLLYHLAELDILLGVFPLAALITMVIWGLRSSQPREIRNFAALAIGVVPIFVLVGAAYAADPTAERIVERNVFHMAPLAFIALAAWAGWGAPRPWWAVAPAALFAGTLTLALPLNNFLNGVAVHSTPSLLPIWRWRDRLFSPDSIDEVVFVAAAMAALLFVLIPRELAVAIPIAVLLFYAAGNRPVEGYTHGASVGSMIGGVGTAPRDWVDRGVGRDTDVATFWWGGTNAITFYEGYFFNRSLGRAYTLSGPWDGIVHAFRHSELKPDGRLVHLDGRPVRERYVFTDRETRFRGTVVASDPSVGLVVYRTDGPLTAVERIDGLFPDRWSGAGFRYKRFDCAPGTLRLSVTSSLLIHPRPLVVSVSVNGVERPSVTIPSRARPSRVDIPVRPGESRQCLVELGMDTGSGLVVGENDQRQLGLRFESVRYSPRR